MLRMLSDGPAAASPTVTQAGPRRTSAIVTVGGTGRFRFDPLLSALLGFALIPLGVALVSSSASDAGLPQCLEAPANRPAPPSAAASGRRSPVAGPADDGGLGLLLPGWRDTDPDACALLELTCEEA